MSKRWKWHGLDSFFPRTGMGGASGIVMAILLELATLAAGGPIGMLPGGVLHGEIAPESQPDLDRVEGEQRLQIQFHSERPRSINTGLVVSEGELYVPAEFALPFTRWPREIAEDERIVVRLGGRLYRARAVRVTSLSLVEDLHRLVAQKYGVPPGVSEVRKKTWFFWIDFPRRSLAQLEPTTGR